MRTLNKLLACAMAVAVPLCTQAQTEIEPNDGSATATPVAYNTAMSGSTGACAPTNSSVDYFSFTPPAQGNMRIQTAMSNTGATNLNVTFRVRQSNTGVVATYVAIAGANNGATNNTFLFPCQGTGVYYISIENPSTTVCTNYSFAYDVIAPAFGNDAEPNDGSSTAIVAAAGVNHEGHLSFRYDNAFDYFRLQAPNDGVLTVTIEAENAGAASGTMDLILRSSTTSALVTWTVNVGANGSPISNTFTRTCTGTEQVYYLEPADPTVCGVSYRFNYSVAAPLYADDLELNQGSSSAINATAGTNYEGRLAFEYDNAFDYYRLQAPNDGVLNVTIQAEHAGTSTTDSLDLYLRAANTGTLVIWRVGIGANGIASTQTFHRTCTGTEQVYYLEPADPEACGVSYRFSYTVTAPVFADDLETNQGSATAIIATAGADYDGRLAFEYDNDFDYYRLQAPTDGVLNLTVQAEHAGASTTDSIEVILRASNTGALKTWKVGIGANGVPNTQILSRTCTGTEEVYYLEPYSPARCGVSYRFNYTVSAPVFADDVEPNSGSATAVNIDLNAAPADGRVEFEYDNNVDYFRINHLGGPIVLHTQAEAAGAAGTMQILIRASNTGLLETAIVPVGGGSVPVTNTYTSAPRAAGVYYLEVFNPTSCGASYRFDCYDDDNDGTCNAFDVCPGGPEPGTPCNDLNACTNNDIIQSSPGCTCAGTLTADSDSDGTCDAVDGCDNDPDKIAPGVCGCGVADVDADGDGVFVCQGDLCDGDPNKIAPGVCGCGVADVDADGDGVYACQGDLCDGDPNKTAPGVCGCGVADVDADGDGVYVCQGDLCDGDPNKTSPGSCGCGNPEPGSTCNDNDANTDNDVVGNDCICAGTPINTCTEDLVLTFNLDAFGSETTWEVRDQSTNDVVEHGGPYADGAAGTQVENLCVAVGCYQLSVFDASGNGISGGGYVLTDDHGRRIVDADGQFGSISSISAGVHPDFCVPVGPTNLKANWCDRTNVTPQSVVRCREIAGATGYQFWFYDPHGNFTRRILRSNNACSLTEIPGGPMPFGSELNVRVRAMVDGHYTGFGKTCTMVGNNSFDGGSLQMSGVEEQAGKLFLFPNPVRDGRVTLQLTGISTDAESTAIIEVFDAMGRLIHSEQGMAANGELNHVMSLDRTIVTGMYQVVLGVNGERFHERLLID